MDEAINHAIMNGIGWPASFAIVGAAFAIVAWFWILAKY